MAQLVAGWFETQEQADRAHASLSAAGFPSTHYGSFYLAPPGQHGDFPLGDEVHHDEGSKNSGKGAAAGAAVGGVAGLAAGAVAAAATAPLGPAAVVAGAGIGAYVGSLAGAVNKSREGNVEAANSEVPVERPAGVIVAVCIDRSDEDEQRAIRALAQSGARGIERATGQWENGKWVDFDPVAPPQLIPFEELPRRDESTEAVNR